MEPRLAHNPGRLQVSVVTLLHRDARLICEVLAKAGIRAEICTGAGEAGLAEALQADCLILAEERLDSGAIESLKHLLETQPAWSDFPVLLLTSGGEVSLSTQKRRERRSPLGNLVLLERPVRPETLISAVQNALRARARQYQIRDQLEQYKQAEEALRRTEKLAVAGRLASSIAHEINNPLEAVTNLLYLMHTCESLEQVHQYLDTAERELARVSEITAHTLKFYRQSARAAPVLVTEIVESALKLYQPRLNSSGIRVEKRFSPIPPVFGMSGELRQVFSNLVGNSLDSMRKGGKLLLRVRSARDYSNGLRHGVRVTIADTGIGIPAEMRKKIFEPFVTTKGATGTGLGLWISSEIIQKHGGNMHMKSRSEGGASTGTAFTIFLPTNNEDRSLPVG